MNNRATFLVVFIHKSYTQVLFIILFYYSLDILIQWELLSEQSVFVKSQFAEFRETKGIRYADD